MKLTGAQFIIGFLQRQGIDTVAGIPGGAVLPLYRALADSGLRHVLARHEQGAAFIAQGMARVSGRAGVCFVTSGPGLTNALTAIADAKADSVPLLCIAGQVPCALIGTDAFQEVATGRLVEPICKAVFEARAVEDLPDLLAEALRVAQSGRPGPVVLEVPKDLQTAACPIGQWPEPVARQRAPSPDALAIDRAAAMIAAAERPVLYLGGGVTQARAQDAAQAFAERAALPTTTTLMALGTLPPEHPLALGMLGQHGANATNRVLDECDLLIAIGARFDDRATGRLDRFCPQAQVIHIDADPRELGKLRRPELALHADAGEALQALLAVVRPTLRGAWLARVADLRREFRMPMPGREDVRRPYGLIERVARIVGPDAVVTTDVGQHQMWVAQSYPFRRPERWLTSGGLGTMGFGLPAAIGAALAAPQLPVVCFSGDGSLLMNAQELGTLAEQRLNVKIVVLDNAALGLVRQQQQLFYDRRHTASLYGRPADLCAIAEGYGVPACDLGAVDDAEQALADALGRPGPMLIRVPLAAEELVLPMVVPGEGNTRAIEALA